MLEGIRRTAKLAHKPRLTDLSSASDNHGFSGLAVFPPNKIL